MPCRSSTRSCDALTPRLVSRISDYYARLCPNATALGGNLGGNQISERRAGKMGYRLAPVQLNVAEGGFAEFRICNDHGETIATFGFADEHEARIARALMIRAIAKAVLIVSHRSVARQNSDLMDDAMTELKRLSDQRE
jgi:hypothetical protein